MEVNLGERRIGRVTSGGWALEVKARVRRGPLVMVMSARAKT